MKALLQQIFFRSLSEYSQRKVSASELTKAVEELAIHVANFSINEQDYSVLLRYFSFGLYRLKGSVVILGGSLWLISLMHTPLLT